MLSLSQAELDRDALLQAIGFKPGPLGEGLRRRVILDDANGLRPAMVEAHRRERDVTGNALLWQALCASSEPQPLLLRVWRQRRLAEKQVRELTAQLDRLAAASEMLAQEVSDPGTEALAAIYCAREALRRVGLGPIVVAPLLDERMFWYLSILQGAGGFASASDCPGEWVSAFCDDRSPIDTYNLAEELGYTQTAHDNCFDSSIVHLTDLGREALALDSRSGSRA